jgi:hypothetical protein
MANAIISRIPEKMIAHNNGMGIAVSGEGQGSDGVPARQQLRPPHTISETRCSEAGGRLREKGLRPDQ